MTIYEAIVTWLIINEIFIIWRMEVAIARGGDVGREQQP